MTHFRRPALIHAACCRKNYRQAHCVSVKSVAGGGWLAPPAATGASAGHQACGLRGVGLPNCTALQAFCHCIVSRADHPLCCPVPCRTASSSASHHRASSGQVTAGAPPESSPAAARFRRRRRSPCRHVAAGTGGTHAADAPDGLGRLVQPLSAVAPPPGGCPHHWLQDQCRRYLCTKGALAGRGAGERAAGHASPGPHACLA